MNYHYVGCDCYEANHFIKFTVDVEEKMPVMVEMWTPEMNWKEKVIAAWDILVGKGYMYTGVVAGREDMLELANFLKEKIK